MTDQEREVVELLGKAWNRYCGLSVENGSDRLEFQQAIHQAQNIVLARMAMRQLKEKKRC